MGGYVDVGLNFFWCLTGFVVSGVLLGVCLGVKVGIGGGECILV